MLDDLLIEGLIVEFHKDGASRRAILRKIGRNELIFSDIQNGSTFKYSEEEVVDMHTSGVMRFLAENRDLGDLTFYDLTDKEQREATRKYAYVKRLKELGIHKITEKSACSLILEIAKERDEKPPHWQTVRLWYRKYVDAGNKFSGLYPKHRFKGSREPKIDHRVLSIIRNESKRFFSLSQPTMASIVRNVEAKVIAHNLDNIENPLVVPTYATVQNRILESSYQKQQKSRQGANSFSAELANSSSGIVTTRILERVEIDHTLLDIHVLHDDFGTLLGRPNITVLIDHFSHMVLGFQISFERPSYASVCIACMNSFLEKESFLESLECESNWPAFGIPDTLVTDNGNEFWGKSFTAVAEEIGTVLQYCPIRKGNYKSRVERFFGTVNSLVLDDLPGVVRKPGKGGEGYDGSQVAKIMFSEFKKYFVEWLTGVYHNLPVPESSLTPNELWDKSAEEWPIPKEDENELSRILMASDTRQLSKGGIRIFSLDYNSSILKDVYRRDGPRGVTIRYNPFDIGYILVLDSINNVYIKVDCCKYEYASGLSLFEHRNIRSKARSESVSKLESPALKETKVKLSKKRDEMHARNSKRKHQITTSRAARSQKIGVTNLKVIVDNSKRNLILDNDEEDDALDLDGWSLDIK